MFDDNVASIRLNFGVRVLANSLISGRFISAQSQSLAAISHTLDKVAILETDASDINQESSEASTIEHDNELSLANLDEFQDKVVYVAIRDVIKSISAACYRDQRDVLLIGCPCSVIIYDVQGRIHLFSIRISSPIECILVPSPLHYETDEFSAASRRVSDHLAICAGTQKLYTIKLDDDDDSSTELTSERSTSGSTITCMTVASLESSSAHFLLTGSANETGGGGTICLYQLDLHHSTNNIQTLRLRLEESAPINCICAIPTTSPPSPPPELQVAKGDLPAPASNLTNAQTTVTDRSAPSCKSSSLKRDHFAYGLRNGLVGVYRLLPAPGEDPQQRTAIGSERSWRHKCKCTPTSLELFDINGDGLDELVIGFASGRLEVRSPLTGQLLGATRLAAGNANPSTDRAQRVGLLQVQLMGSLWLLGCTGRGTVIGFRPLASKPRQTLQVGWSAGSGQHKFEPIESWHPHQSTSADEIDLRSNRTTNEQQAADSFADNKCGDLHTPAAAAGSSPTPAPDKAPASEPKSGTGSIESRQSYDLLQKINSLYAQQIDLRQRVSRALVSADTRLTATATATATGTTRSQASRYSSSCLSSSAGELVAPVSIRHRWDLDLAKLELRLTIVVSNNSSPASLATALPAQAQAQAQTEPSAPIGVSGGRKAVKLVQVEEEKRILIESGCQLLENQQQQQLVENSAADLRDALFVSQLGFGANLMAAAATTQFEPTSLKLRLFLANHKQNLSNKQSSSGEICQKLIDVPKFAMFTFAPKTTMAVANSRCRGERSAVSPDADAAAAAASGNRKYIRLCYRLDDRTKFEQVFDWLEENFLCLRANQIGFAATTDQDDDDDHISNITSYSSERSRFLSQQTEESCFELKLVDAKQTLLLRTSSTTSSHESQCKSSLVRRPEHPAECCSLLRISLYRRRQSAPASNGSSSSIVLQAASASIAVAAANRLELECESAELAVHLVQSLVIDRLRLDPISSCPSDSCIPKLASILSSLPSSSSIDNLVACCNSLLLSQEKEGQEDEEVTVRPILEEFLEAHKRLGEQEESESRILTELYESADYAKNLMQQLGIAIELDEFLIARELLGELFMMLDGAHNAARGHSLNNRSRQQLARKFQQVREKLTLITTGRLPR